MMFDRSVVFSMYVLWCFRVVTWFPCVCVCAMAFHCSATVAMYGDLQYSQGSHVRAMAFYSSVMLSMYSLWRFTVLSWFPCCVCFGVAQQFLVFIVCAVEFYRNDVVPICVLWCFIVVSWSLRIGDAFFITVSMCML